MVAGLLKFKEYFKDYTETLLTEKMQIADSIEKVFSMIL